MHILLRALILAGAILGTAAAPVSADGLNPAARSAAQAADRAAADGMIDQIADAVIARLKAKPEIMLDIILSYEEKMRAGHALIRPEDPASGPDNADVTIVEFFDPSCLPCRTAGAALDEVAAADDKIRVVHKEFPTSPEGVTLSLNALGSANYFEARKAILAGRAPASAGDEARRKATAILAQDREAATRAAVKVMPTMFFIAGGRAERAEGQITKEAISARIAAARARIRPSADAH